MQYGKPVTDARFEKPSKRKTSFRTVASAVSSQYVCVEVLQHKGKGEWMNFLTELMPVIERAIMQHVKSCRCMLAFGEEISTPCHCVEKINLLRDSSLVLRNDGLQSGFSCL